LFIRKGIPTGDTDTVFNLTDGDVGEGQRQGARFLGVRQNHCAHLKNQCGNALCHQALSH
jgi:hypothetical protein